MIIDSQNGGMANGAITAPDWVFGDVPKQVSEIVETSYVTGNDGTNVSIQTTVDDNG